MDVEAQDDGVLAKIIIPSGSRSIKVGKTIAVLAEQGDDLSGVEVAEEGDSRNTPPMEPEQETNPTESRSTENKSGTSQNKIHITESYTPAVLRLLKEFRIEDASVITPTGPHGRILKGDVLAYTGSIGKQVPQILNEILIKKQQLDLTNIKVQKPETSPAALTSVPMPISKQRLEPASIMTVVRVTELLRMRHRLSGMAIKPNQVTTLESLSIDLPIEALVKKASALAMKDVPAFGLKRKPSADVLFDELVGQSSIVSTLFRPVTSFIPHPKNDKTEASSFDGLTGLFAATMYLRFLLHD